MGGTVDVVGTGLDEGVEGVALGRLVGEVGALIGATALRDVWRWYQRPR